MPFIAMPADEYHRLRALQIEWTSEKPSAPGLYWARDTFPPSAPAIVQVFDEGEGALSYRFIGWRARSLSEVSELVEWAGPLEPPK